MLTFPPDAKFKSMLKRSDVRNFCIIAHVDHGKSTLADRLLELTNTVEKRAMRDQMLDQMDLERERGITIKLQPVTMKYAYNGASYTLNLIDTPGHIDFTYEVSRSLSAVEGAVLLVDATQGIQAQTLANWNLSREQNLKVIPALNKIDLPNADVEGNRRSLANLLNVSENDVILVSAKTGEGVGALLDSVIEKLPPPSFSEVPTRALIFDSFYDEFLGVVAYVRIKEGALRAGARIIFLSNKEKTNVIEVGTLAPQRKKGEVLSSGDIGYVVTGLKNLEAVRVGDTIALDSGELPEPISGWKEVKPMVFASIYSEGGEDFEELRKGMSKLKLNDAALVWEVERSRVLGYGIRAGFLGLLHLEIIQERLKREYGITTVVTIPGVRYELLMTDGEIKHITSPSDWPEISSIREVKEPWIRAEIVCPKKYVGAVMQLIHERRGEYRATEYLPAGEGEWSEVSILKYFLPLSVILVDFYDQLKSVSSGFATLNYELDDYRPADVARLDIFLADELEEELSMIVYRDESYRRGRKVVIMLKELLPKQQFVLKIQAAIGGKIIAAERLSALRKDVTAKLYGGDVTRKRKLLEKQKKGKKKMALRGKGSVVVPPDVYLKLLKG